MKESIFKYLPQVFVLYTIAISVLMATSVKAEQIDRSRYRNDQIPTVTDLNLSIPTDQESPSERSIEVEIPPSPTIENPTKTKGIRRRTILGATISQNRQKVKSNYKQRIATVSPPPFGNNYLRLVRNSAKGTNRYGNPIYTLEAYVGGRRYQKFNVVSGTGKSQRLDRHAGNNYAPLPDGLYNVSNQIIASNVPDVGKTFIGIDPRFSTNRTGLGIHLDVSFNQANGHDGTAGCIGLTTSADRDAINAFVLKYQPHNLFVSIMPK